VAKRRHRPARRLEKQIIDTFDRQSSAFYTSGRLLDDGIIDPRDTRKVLAYVLSICREADARTPAAGAVRRAQDTSPDPFSGEPGGGERMLTPRNTSNSSAR
jgi:hypothetical protein